MAYQVTHGKILEWLDTGPDGEAVDAVLAAVRMIAADPHSGVPVPARVPVYVWRVAVAELIIRYMVAEQFRTVNVISIEAE